MQPPPEPKLNHPSLIASIRREFHPSRLISSLTAATITGVVAIIYAISFVALIFSGDLAPYISIGIGVSLFSAMIQSLIIALLSSLPGVVAHVQDTPAAIMGVVATAIVAQRVAPTAEVLPTVIVTEIMGYKPCPSRTAFLDS